MIFLDDDEQEVRHTLCQLCGYMPVDPAKESFNKWRVYTYNTLDGISIHVIACPRCRTTDAMAALGVYQKRVSTGLDLNFH